MPPDTDAGPSTAPLVGRAEHLGRLVRTVTGPQPRSAVLCGEEGVGTTRLAREVLAAAGDVGWGQVWVAATSATATIPFGAVAHLLPAVPPADRGQVVHAVARSLTSDVDGRRSVVGVDEAHLLDDASAALVHHLAVTGTAVVVATVRAGAPVPAPVTALWKDGLADRVDVAPLAAEETALLAEELLGGPVDGLTQRRLWRLSRGNALYLGELVRSGLATGTLVRRDGVWCWAGPVAAVPRLVEVLAHRLGDQPADVRDLVDLVAFGEPVDLALLERAGVDAAAVEAAERAGLLRSEASATGIDVRLAHPLVATVARARSSVLHRTRVCRRLAQAADAGSDGIDALRTAVWHLDGGTAPEPAGLVAAARQALAVLDLPLAARLARAAVDGGGDTRAVALLATVLVHCGAGEEAEALLARLDGTAPPELAELRAWNLVLALGRPEDAERVLAEAAAGGPAAADCATVARARFHTLAGEVGEAGRLAADLAARPGTTDPVRLGALLTLCQVRGVEGRYGDAVGAGQEARELAGGLDGGAWSLARDEVRGGLVAAHVGAGRLDAAQPLVEEGREATTAAGWPSGAAMWTAWRGELALLHGRPDTALRSLREAVALATQQAHPYRDWVTRIAATSRAQAAAVLGRVEEAAAAVALAERLGRPWTGLLTARVTAAAAWVDAARGGVRAAVQTTLHAADHAAGHGQTGWELLLRHQAVRLGAADRVADRLGELGGRVDGALAPLLVAHARAVCENDGDALEEVARGLAGLGLGLLAAEAAAHAAGAHRAQGRTAGATRATATARVLAGRCEGARTPALAGLAEPSALTRRENEIARLAAAGLTNRRIAEELVISVRTVDNTLHQAYAKLGVHGRADLRPLFRPDLGGPGRRTE
ncbi:regulatory protein, luxR family [Geodermatophilus dictyosporus]|uniref:Regulatory protein, luxR family n=1 Tax=Geodermatophilus dictyosporus TaxID=1523247 RepID=A0A1I5R6E5_9ACTN|nr:LuxR C-terminal-related transcriptional regulator [Geodermatophilus dictyosporus]SFP54073.1 regulatory protein, luxR family [Geodermatophilus dictyosporus]